MPEPIKISLARNGKVVVLSKETAQIAFNNLWQYRPEGSESDFMPLTKCRWHKNKSYTLWQILVKYHLLYKPKVKLEKLTCNLSLKEIKFIEQFINFCLIEKNFPLQVEDERKVLLGPLSANNWTNSKKNALYTNQYGLKFLLEYMPKEKAFNVPGQHLVLEDQNGKIQQVYYHSIIANPTSLRLEIRLSNFWKRSEIKNLPLESFNPKRIFTVKEIFACKGFEILK